MCFIRCATKAQKGATFINFVRALSQNSSDCQVFIVGVRADIASQPNFRLTWPNLPFLGYFQNHYSFQIN